MSSSSSAFSVTPRRKMSDCGQTTKITHLTMIQWLYDRDPQVLRQHDWQFGAFVLTPMAFCGLLGNGLSFAVLLRPRFEREFRCLRLHLVLLSLTEITFCGTYMTLDIIRAVIFTSGLRRAGDEVIPATDVLLTGLIDSSLSLRNWCIALIALSRLEVVMRPLASLRCKIFSNSRVKGMFAGFLLTSLTISSLRQVVIKKFALCLRNSSSNDSQSGNESYIYHDSDTTFYEVLFVFAFQRVLPILFITISTCAITFKLVIRHSCRGSSENNRKSLRNKTNAHLANRTVVFLTVVCLLLEGTYVIYKIIDLSGVVDLWAYAVILEKTNRVFLMLDSCSNAAIYVLANRVLKDEVIEFLKCLPCVSRARLRQSAFQAVPVRDSNSDQILSTNV